MKTRIFNIPQVEGYQKEISAAAEILRGGGVVAIPTETVYGLGANGLDPAAVDAVYEAKGRPSDNPLILHIPEASWLERYCAQVPERARRLAEAFWPGPLTMILPRNPCVPYRTTGGLETVGVRCPDHPVARAIISAAGVPVAAPSANRSGRPSCTTADHVCEDMMGRIPGIVDGGACAVGVESTILDLTGERPRLLRPGGLPVEELERVIGPVERDPALVRPLEKGERPLAPGMKYRHYAPKAPVTVVAGAPASGAEYIRKKVKKGEGVICFTEFLPLFQDIPARDLGSLQDKEEQAHRVFDALRAFDETDVSGIYAQCPDPSELGLAVENRLKKAAGFHVVDADAEAVPAQRFLQIGITGGTGAGKTTALWVLGRLGVYTIDCDAVYHRLLKCDGDLRRDLTRRFGDIFTPQGLDRKKLGTLVFRDPEALRSLNEITHARIGREVDRQIKQARASGMHGVAVDAIALIEGGRAAQCDVTVAILAPEEERVRRIMEREGIGEEYARTRIRAQKDNDFFREHCDYILDNDGTIEEFARRARALFTKLLGGDHYE